MGKEPARCGPLSPNVVDHEVRRVMYLPMPWFKIQAAGARGKLIVFKYIYIYKIYIYIIYISNIIYMRKSAMILVIFYNITVIKVTIMNDDV
jgi:hypothetical protein